jgi:hypothetical protein
MNLKTFKNKYIFAQKDLRLVLFRSRVTVVIQGEGTQKTFPLLTPNGEMILLLL